MRYKSAGSSDAGFTLVELLAALALTAIIATFILAGFSLARRAWLNSVAGERTGEIKAASTRLRDLLSKTVPALSVSKADRLARLAFDGRRQSIVFVTLSEGETFPGGLMRVHLAWDQSPDGKTPAPVMLTTAVFRSHPRLVTGTKRVVLFRDVADFSLKYFGSWDVGKPREWHSEWRGRGRLPALVQAEVHIGDGKRLRRLLLPIPLRHSAAP